jgi:hypothetical protein
MNDLLWLANHPLRGNVMGFLTSRDPDTPEGPKSCLSIRICRISAELPHSTELELRKLHRTRLDSDLHRLQASPTYSNDLPWHVYETVFDNMPNPGWPSKEVGLAGPTLARLGPGFVPHHPLMSYYLWLRLSLDIIKICMDFGPYDAFPSSGGKLSYLNSKEQNRSLYTCAQDVQIKSIATIW